jgi:hypothetical protein
MRSPDIAEILRGIFVIFCVAIGEVFATSPKTQELVGGFVQDQTYIHLVGIAVALIPVAIFYFVVALVADWSRWSKLARNIRFPSEAHYEDFWLQQTGLVKRPFSMGWIHFDRSEQDWVYRGLGFDNNFQLAAEWESRSVHYDSHNGRWLFYGSANLLEPGAVLGANVIPILHTPRPPKHGNIKAISGRVADIGVEADKNIIGRVFEIELKRASVSKLVRASNLYPKSWVFWKRLPSFEQIKGMDKDARADEVRELFRQMKFLAPGNLKLVNLVEVPREEARADEERAI